MDMDLAYQLSTLAAVAVVIDVMSNIITSQASVNQSITKSAESLINMPSNTVQTTKWTYSSSPNALLFDFSDVRIKKDQILPAIRSSLPPHIIATIRPIGELLAEVVVQQDQKESNTLHKQVYSILKYKGLHLKDKNIWLKPTTALSSHPNLSFWRIRLLEYPKSLATDAHKKLIADNIQKAIKSRDKSSPGSSVLEIRSHNVYFGNADLDDESRQCTVTLLAEEFNITPPPYMNHVRKLIYIPFMKRYLPIEMYLVE